jgi:type IV pilus assembly protein PilM
MSLKEKKSFFKSFPTPEYLLLSTCGIAVSDESVKFVEFSRGFFGSSLELSHYARTALPEGVVASGYINDAEKLTAVLKEVSVRYGIRFARATLPEERAYLFTAHIERVPADGLRDAVAFIIEENVPVKLADSVFDFDIVEDNPTSSQIKVTVSVLSKKVVDFYIQVFEAAGITPVSFDIESQAIARAIIPKGEKRTQMIINLSQKKTGFYVVEEEVVQFTTTLPVGAAGEAPYPHIADLVSEMRKIFAFWSARGTTTANMPEKKIEKILLCGLGAGNGAFVAEFMANSPVEYALGNPWVNIAESAKALSSKDISKETLDYASAIGLALPNADKNYV